MQIGCGGVVKGKSIIISSSSSRRMWAEVGHILLGSCGVMSEVLPPKRQAAVDRLRRRVEVYTKDHQDRFMHYERIGPALCEQQMQESFALKQKYLDPKAKKTSSSKSNKSSSSSSGTSNSSTNNNNNNSNGVIGASSAERKPATETHAGNTQSVRKQKHIFSRFRLFSFFSLAFFIYLVYSSFSPFLSLFFLFRPSSIPSALVSLSNAPHELNHWFPPTSRENLLSLSLSLSVALSTKRSRALSLRAWESGESEELVSLLARAWDDDVSIEFDGLCVVGRWLAWEKHLLGITAHAVKNR